MNSGETNLAALVEIIRKDLGYVMLPENKPVAMLKATYSRVTRKPSMEYRREREILMEALKLVGVQDGLEPETLDYKRIKLPLDKARRVRALLITGMSAYIDDMETPRPVPKRDGVTYKESKMELAVARAITTMEALGISINRESGYGTLQS